MKRGIVILMILFFLLLGGALAAVVVNERLHNKPSLPSDISKQLTSASFYPAKQSATIDSGTYKYDEANKLFSYIAHQQGNRLVFSMQPSPSEFSDVPEAYSKYLEKLNKTASFDTTYGNANITEPEGQPGQVAVMNARGTLLFVRSDTKLTEDQWRVLLNSLEQQ